MSWLNREERQYILRWYASDDVTNDEMAADLGMSMLEFFEACTECGLVPRKEPDIFIPTPAEIAIAAAKIRDSWSAETLETRLRMSGGPPEEWEEVDCGDEEEDYCD